MLSVLGWDVVPNCTTAQCVEMIYKTTKIFAAAAGSVPNPNLHLFPRKEEVGEPQTRVGVGAEKRGPFFMLP